MNDLFIIEAPGKANALQDILKGIGIDARVQATRGHLYSMPDKLTPIGIDSGFREFERKLRDTTLGERIRTEALAATRVYIATDADQEGDVIAWDVAELISDIHNEPLRVRLKGMDEDSVRDAIEMALPVSKRDAVAGRTRAIVDRMIGAVFSRDGIAVGRVGTALLGVVDKTQPVVGRLRLVAPAKQGGRPWIADCEIRAPICHAVANKLVGVKFPALDTSPKSMQSSSPPSHMGDIMVRAGDQLDMSPKEAATAMQRLYEAGKMSYPRAGSRGISRGVLSKIGKILQNSGYKFDEEVFPDKQDEDVHDAPHPIGKLEVQRDPKKQGFEEGIRTLVGRDLIKSGQTHEIQFGIGDRAADHLKTLGFTKDICDLVSKLEWRRENGPRYPGQETWPESSITMRRPDTVLLEAAVNLGLGRPSTWANHIENFMGRGLVDEDLNITAKGRSWIAGSPPALLDPRISAAIENACERNLDGMMDSDREPWELLAERIISSLPETLKRPLVGSIESIPVHPKENPLAPFVETVGLDEIIQKSQERRLNFGPRGPVSPSQ